MWAFYWSCQEKCIPRSTDLFLFLLQTTLWGFKKFLWCEAFYKRITLSALEWESMKSKQRSISVNYFNHQPKSLTPSKTLTYFVEHSSGKVLLQCLVTIFWLFICIDFCNPWKKSHAFYRNIFHFYRKTLEQRHGSKGSSLNSFWYLYTVTWGVFPPFCHHMCFTAVRSVWVCTCTSEIWGYLGCNFYSSWVITPVMWVCGG